MSSVTLPHPARTALLPQLPALRRRLEAARRLFLFADFDGTLAPIVPVPAAAALPAEVRRILGAICRREDIVLTVISGRALDDLRPRVGLPAIYAGNHGMEIFGPKFHHTAGDACAEQQLAAACRRLRTILRPFAGVELEDKGLTATVHVRHAARSDVPAVHDLVQATVRGYPALRVSTGLEVFELRPRLGWHKGTAVRWILEQTGGLESEAICLGDDSSDEDMFQELAAGITVRVEGAGAGCGNGATSAQYRLEAEGVSEFLGFLLETRTGGEA